MAYMVPPATATCYQPTTKVPTMLLTLLLLALLTLPCLLAMAHVYTWPHAQTRAQRSVARVAARQHVHCAVHPAGGNYNYWLQYSGTPVANLPGSTRPMGARTLATLRTWGRYHG